MAHSANKRLTDFIPEAKARTLAGLFRERMARSPDAIAYQQYDDQQQRWQKYTWQEVGFRVNQWRDALARETLARGDRIAVMLPNGVEWICFDQAAQSLGLILVAVYPTDTPEDIAYILADAGARLLLLRDVERWHELAPHCDDHPALKRVWCLSSRQSASSSKDERLRHVDNLLAAEPPEVKDIDIQPDDTATIIYTSGTTGRSKGVMLSHQNILANAEAVQKIIPAFPDDIFLSFLPLAHGFERTVEYYLPMMAGSCVCYARSIKMLAEDMSVIRPTVFLSAPRLYEKIYVAIQNKLAASAIKRQLFRWTLDVGWQHFLSEQKQRPPLNLLQRLAWKILRRLVAQKILARLGGRIRVAVTGAAPLSPRVGRFFMSLDLPLIEGYGLTEAGPVVSGNRLDENRMGTVGKPLPGVEVVTTAQGELLVRSPAVMQGYWRREEDTGKALDEDGWLHTGDLAEIDEHGFIHILGRLKDVLVTSTGEKVPPADLEAAITLNPLFEQAMVVGEGKPYLVGLIVINQPAWEEFAEQHGIKTRGNQALYLDETRQLVLDKLMEILAEFPVYAQIRAVYLTFEPWTIENGLLTPTLKLKRNMLENHYQSEIKELYRGHAMIE